MGAEVESSMYFPGYYALRNVNDNASAGGSKHGGHFDRFLTRPATFEDNLLYAREQMKQTILKHEYTFKHQLQELHRIYRRQRDLMNDVEYKGLYEQRKPEKTSQTSLFSSRIIYEDADTEWHAPDFRLMNSSFSRPSTSAVGIIRSPHSLTEKKNTMQPGPLSIYNGIRSEKCESYELTCKKLQRRLFDLEVPADKYLNDEEKKRKSYHLDMNNEPILVEEPNLSMRKHHLVDLNESIQIEETFVSASVKTSGNNSCSSVEARAWQSSTISGFHPSSKEFSYNSQRRRDGAACPDDLHLQNGKNAKEWFSSFSEAEQTRGSKDLCKPSGPMKFEPGKVCEPFTVFPLDHCRMKLQTKRTIFGVELSASEHDLPIMGCDMSILDPNCPSSSNSAFFSSWRPFTPDEGTNCSKSNQSEVISYQNFASTDGKKECSTQLGHMPWPIIEKDRPNRMESYLLQNSSQLFARKPEVEKCLIRDSIQDSTLCKSAHDAEQKISCHSQSIAKILGVPIYDKPHSNPPSKTSSSSDNNAAKVELINNDIKHDLPKFGKQQKFEGLVLEKRPNNSSNDIKHHIDLNLCLVEEEVSLAPSTPNAIVKNAGEIDLEAPVVLDTEKDDTCKVESLQRPIKKSCESSQEESSESHEGLVKNAAEAIVTLSSFCTYDPSVDSSCLPSDTLTSDPLQWFADMVSCHKHELENEAIENSKGSFSCEVCNPDEFDYFEFMTLKLTETEKEECSYMPNDSPPDQRDEDTLPKRPRRGQARRGRPRKDFIRDILPTISSLSRNEVTEDIQTFEAIVRASGGIWESSLAKRKNGKSGSGRGRKRISTPTPNISATFSPPRQQTNHTQTMLEEGRLVGWGKRTRRPPRQRGPVIDPPLMVK